LQKSPKNLKKISVFEKEKFPASENLNIKELKVGNEVLHDRFGKGKVIELNGDYPNTKATVFFASAGQKQLLLKFAKLQLVKN
jgi:DNA helicase-2/ATP-dependent DNA helicase PcrA